MKKFFSLILAYLFLGLAIIGMFLPILPTVPFLLLSSWFALRGSEKLHYWLWTHPRFGKILRDWEQHGAISRRSKITAVVMLIISWWIMFYVTDIPWLLPATAILFSLVSIFIISRPENCEADDQA